MRGRRPDGALAFAAGRRHGSEAVGGDTAGESGAAESRGEEAEAAASEAEAAGGEAEAAGGEHGGEAIFPTRL